MENVLMWQRRLPILLALLALGCNQGKPGATPPQQPSSRLIESQVAELDKLFAVFTDALREYENLLATAKFPNDEAKNEAKVWIKTKQLDYELARLALLKAKSSGEFEDVRLLLALGQNFIEVPNYTFGKYNYQTGNHDMWVSTTRCESLRDDYITLAIAFARTIPHQPSSSAS
jgi:hypothetical protein